jgi:hypothetical protein
MNRPNHSTLEVDFHTPTGIERAPSCLPGEASKTPSLTNLSGAVVDALDFGSGGWWFESKSSHKIYLGVIIGERYLCQAFKYA